MATDRQIAANRANAKKSTGPRTQAGRARSGQNARLHGLSADSLNLRSNPEYQQVVSVLVGDSANQDRVDAAWNFVDAQVKLVRIAERRSKAFTELELPETSINYLQVRRATALDRYERYAYSQLLRAISKLEG